MKPEVGQALREAREMMGLSQRELARIMDTQHSHISEYESGLRNIGWARMVRIAKILGVSLDDLAKLELEDEN